MCSATAGDVVSLFTNHPKFGDIAAFNQALCGLYAAGLGKRITISAEILAHLPAGRYPRASGTTCGVVFESGGAIDPDDP